MRQPVDASVAIDDGNRRLRAAFGGKRVAVLGIGLSNLPVIEKLLAAGAIVTAADRLTREELGQRYAAIASYPVRLVLGPEYLGALQGQDVAFLTPGMRRDLPELLAAHARGVTFSSEMVLFFTLCQAPIVGITGSAGKTTTTTLVGLMLQATRSGVWVGGNIGRPLLGDVHRIGAGDLAVVELSSFQLQDMAASPQIAAVLNVSPNHLDIHPSMGHYVNAKRNIYSYQAPRDYAVFNYDNPTSRNMAREYDREMRRKGKGHPPIVYSRVQNSGTGAYLDGDSIVLSLGACDPGFASGVVCRRQELRLLGEHNVENVLAAATVAGLAGASMAAIREVATTFRGVEHRLEPVREVAGIRFYNDSKATTPDQTIAALRALPGPLVLILGGYDKRIGFEGLAHEILVGGKVRHAVLTGATASLIREAIVAESRHLAGRGASLSQPAITRVPDFAAAVHAAYRLAEPGDTVLLSPACASFDSFPNFEERGRIYKSLVAALPDRSA